MLTVAAALARALPSTSTSGSTVARLPSPARTAAAPLPTRQTFGATYAPIRGRSPTRAQTVGAVSDRALKWQPIGAPTAVNAPTPVLSVAGALARSQPWPSTSGSIGLVPGGTGAGVPVRYLCLWPLAKGTWTHLWVSSTTQKYSRSVGDGLRDVRAKGEDLDIARGPGWAQVPERLWQLQGGHRSPGKRGTWG